MSKEHLFAIVAILVNVAGFMLVSYQIRQQAIATRGETYASLCGLSYDILNMFVERPYLYPYFYDQKPLSEAGDKRVEVLACCEMIANYCDNTALQQESIPREIWERWRNFIHGQLQMSSVLRDFLRKYRAWYSPEIGRILDEVETGLASGGSSAATP